MHLTPELITKILVRQGVLSRAQAEEVTKEVRMMPRHLRSATAYALCRAAT